MKSEELAAQVRTTIEACEKRILGIGREQYEEDNEEQLFERLPIPKLVTMAEEELEDIIVYAVMLRIRLNRFMALLNARGWDS